MAQALYRKYRSRSLNEIVGQEHIVSILANALKSGRINHAYLLTGPKGVGKTSIARILAHEINNLTYSEDTHLDIIEIDAASNNGVDDVRDLREKVTIAPVSASKKIYIIDEVHMLSKPAFNALLKTLEEPPEHVVFILATTEIHKLPETILSRTQRFHFRLIDNQTMAEHLTKIAKKENISIDKDALLLIAQRAGGSFRDGISLLDQLQSLDTKKITATLVEQTLGLASQESVETLIEHLTHHRLDELVKLLNDLEEGGISPVILASQISAHLRTVITKEPQLIPLIDELIEVGRSYDPGLKLLVSLASTSVSSDKPHKVVAVRASSKASITAPSLTPKAVKTPPIKEERPDAGAVLEKLDWNEYLGFIRKNHTPLYGVLARASADFKDSELRLHFSYSLHKKKLDDGKYRQMLTDSLYELYKSVPNITITSGKRLPQNATAASVAAIMGGGEEINVS